jgi:hypothetical protein
MMEPSHEIGSFSRDAYRAWSLLDNIERADGYPAIGLTHLDSRSLNKDSDLWYRRVAASNRLNVGHRRSRTEDIGVPPAMTKGCLSAALLLPF